ncbi:MAG: hypothetical protein JO100_04140 [Pseudonocardia sp.]|nr:hypothetical protein [Pseudonocardia sp.]
MSASIGFTVNRGKGFLMAYRLLAGGCDNGPCGTFYLDEVTGNVVVQGYLTEEKPAKLPPGEGFLMIPAAQWRILASRLSKA